ncbi:hypothetical protein BKA65DRAFT_159414 [Rhexocercosporidium sp. MPI-PUGE-AT-0058]|nr:hypothetical protein BKA65DRAFT_159414 [Rhexocercosporidium sp. MPI-PUGE-AT-0058]
MKSYLPLHATTCQDLCLAGSREAGVSREPLYRASIVTFVVVVIVLLFLQPMNFLFHSESNHIIILHSIIFLHQQSFIVSHHQLWGLKISDFLLRQPSASGSFIKMRCEPIIISIILGSELSSSMSYISPLLVCISRLQKPPRTEIWHWSLQTGPKTSRFINAELLLA